MNFSSSYEALILQAANCIVCWFCSNVVILVPKMWRDALSSFDVLEYYNIEISNYVLSALLFVRTIIFNNRIINNVARYPIVDWYGC